MRYAARVDGPHARIVERCRQLGADVVDLSRVGHGCPDLLVCFRRGLYLLEVKAVRGQLTPDQVRWQQRGWPVHVVRDPSEIDLLLLGRPLDLVTHRT